MTESEQADLAEAFAAIARELEAESSPEKTQDRVTRAALATVDGCDHAAISIIHRWGGVETVAATDDVPPHVDAIQYAAGQGPCLDAMSEHEISMIDDLTVDDRWPEFSRRAAEETGVRSMLSFRLFVRSDTIGALNLYSRHPAVFDENSCAVGAFALLRRASQHLHRKLREVAAEVVDTGEIPGRPLREERS